MARVLIVQGSPVIQQLRLIRETQADQLRSDLEAEGFDVDVCLDLDTARAALERTTYDVTVVDATVPGTQGFDLCQKLKTSANGARAPLLLVLSPTDPAHIVRSLECADSLIAVPYE